MPSQHIWKDKDAEGRKREVRATKFGGVWRLQAKVTGENAWTYYDRPLLDDLRASADDVASVDKLIKDQNRE